MTILNKIKIAAASTLIALSLNAKQPTMSFSPETLNYRVMYKWGMVNKQAGHASLSLKNRGGNYSLQLTAASESWADKFYKVRDTLNGTVNPATLMPTFYEKKSHEGGEFKHDIIHFTKNGATTIGKCSRKSYDKNGKLTVNENKTLQGIGTTVDMLSSYYYMRSIPYDTWKVGQLLTLNIFSGKRKEYLTIKYLGTEKVTVDKKTYNCYHISFLFTEDGGKKSSDDMEAWISNDARRIPIKLEGKLKVGKVKCFYTGG
jgi:hypothetical protein